MELMLALGVGLFAGCGVYLLLRARSFDLILGITVLSYAVNLFIFATGRLAVDRTPILAPDTPATLAHYADPLPQALVLTAIVIGFGMTALLVAVALAARRAGDDDHVDAGRQEPE
ncbi:MAG: Na+/H+ antiporter subunit C [Immundisolibacter sp.]|uniref:Na+/H+ antiporter subunit C n=1 Tax=Immundisolibacter sp. TaxID=1934948 RepID=UPI003EE1BFE1